MHVAKLNALIRGSCHQDRAAFRQFEEPLIHGAKLSRNNLYGQVCS